MNYDIIKSNTTRNQMNETNDCTVIATALTVGVSYEDAHAALKAQGRKHRRGAYMPQQERAIKALGGKIKRKLSAHLTIHGQKLRQSNGAKYTPASIGRDYNKGIFYCFVRSHCFALIDGVVQDWTAGRRHLVTEIWEIEPVGNVTNVTPPAPKPVRVDPGKKTKAAVIVTDGNDIATQYSSMKVAFEELGLYMPHHQKVRRITKLKGSCEYDGFLFEATYKA